MQHGGSSFRDIKARDTIINFCGDYLLPIFYLSLILSNPSYCNELLLSSIPIRSLFQPSSLTGTKSFNWDGIIFLYVLPILYGLFLAYRRKKAIKGDTHPYFSSVKLCYIYSLLVSSPFYLLLRWPDIWEDPALFHVLGYTFLLVPLMMSIGFFLYLVIDKNKPQLEVRRTKLTKLHFIIFLSLIIAFIAIKTAMILKSQYPIGNDVYYHTSLSLHIKEGFSPFTSPLMEGVPNSYPFLGHVLVTYISKVTGASVLRIWPFFDLGMQVLTLVTVSYLAYYLSDNVSAALIALIMFLPWDQFWLEHSSRRIALALAPLFWMYLVKYTKQDKKRYLLYSGLILIFMIASHHLVTILAVVVGIVYLFIFFVGEKLVAACDHLISRLKPKKGICLRPRVSSCFTLALVYNDLPYTVAFYVLAVTLISLLLFGFMRFGPDRMLYFGEIGLSFNKPIGITTLAIFPMGFIGLVGARRDDRSKRMLLLAIATLFLTTFFYITKLGIFYPDIGLHHFRIAAEMSCISFVICGSLLLVSASRSNNGAWRRAVAISVVIILVLSGVSIYGKMRVHSWYAASMEQRMEIYAPVLGYIKELPPESIIAANPDDFINRYIPGVSGKRIYVARYFSDERVAIISPGLDFFEPEGLRERYDLASAYFADPTDLNLLKRMEAYSHIDYILLDTRNPANDLLEESSDFVKVYQDKEYCLYRLSSM